MRKKIITLLMISALALSGCSNENTSEPEPETKTTAEATKSPDATSPAQETDTPEPQETQEAPQEKKDASLDDIEQHMLENNAVSGEKTQMVADMIGAISGFKYSDSNVEIYEYDVNSKNYKALTKGKKIPIEGFEGYEVGAAAINGKFVLMGEPSKKAINAFNSFKAN